MGQIDAVELTARIDGGENLNLLDVREVIEYHTYNIGGQNIPLPKLEKSIGLLRYNKTDEIVVVCKAGLRSGTACDILAQNGYERARNLTGGLMALQKIKK